MRFIVDFYRYAILAVLALLIAGFAFLILFLSGSPDFADVSVASFLVAGVVLLGFFGVSFGLIATFISIHDRHIELVQEVKMMRETLEQRGRE